MSSLYAKRGQLYFSVKVGRTWRAVRSPFKVGQERRARSVLKQLEKKLDFTAMGLKQIPSGPCVYLVQMMPAGAPWVVKVGFSIDLRARLKTFRCLCPEAQVIATLTGLAGTAAMERSVLITFEREYRKLGTEVFEVGDINDALERFAAAGLRASELPR